MIESVRNSSTTIISLGYIKLSIELEVLVFVLNLASTSILEQGGPEHSSNSLLVEENLAAASLIRFCFLVLNKSWHHDTLTLDHKSWGHPPCGEAREKYSWTFPSSFGTSKCIIGLNMHQEGFRGVQQWNLPWSARTGPHSTTVLTYTGQPSRWEHWWSCTFNQLNLSRVTMSRSSVDVNSH